MIRFSKPQISSASSSVAKASSPASSKSKDAYIAPASTTRKGLLKESSKNRRDAKQRDARGYDREFKEIAVAQVESGWEIKEVACNLGT